MSVNNFSVPPKNSSLDADTLLWKFLGDRRYLLMLPRAVALQMLHPSIAAAMAHTQTPTRIWPHKQQTVPQLVNMAYSSRDLSSVIRYGHEHIKGHNEFGQRYHALDPELFYFQHATYVDTLVSMVCTFIRPLTPDELDQLYLECCAWYNRYGISARHSPRSWNEFTEYFDDVCRTMLRVNAAGGVFTEQILRPDDWVVRHIPTGAVRAMMHPVAATLLDIKSSHRDFLVLRRFVIQRTAIANLPQGRYTSVARNALREAR